MRGIDAYRAMYGYSPFRQAGRGGGGGGGGGSDWSVLANSLGAVALFEFSSGALGINGSDLAVGEDATVETNLVEAAGQVGGAATFNGTNSIMKVPTYAAINDIVIASATFTMEAIIKVPTGPSTGVQTIISKGSTTAGSGGGGFFLYWNAATNKPIMWIGQSGVQWAYTANATLTKDTFMHVVAVGTSGSIGSGAFYYDGASVGYTSLTSPSGGSQAETNDLRFGATGIAGVDGNFGNLTICSAAMYPTVLSAANVAALATAAGF